MKDNLKLKKKLAYRRGRDANRKGHMCAPVGDPIMEEIANSGLVSHSDMQNLYRKWIEGWTWANLHKEEPKVTV